MKKIIFLSIAVIAVGVFSFFYLKSDNAPVENNSKTILFYGIGCPHCKIVDEFIEQNKISEKIQYDHLEVFSNRANAKIMEEKAVQCKLDTKEIGVPFLWDDGRCFVGDKDIIDHFKEKINDNQ